MKEKVRKRARIEPRKRKERCQYGVSAASAYSSDAKGVSSLYGYKTIIFLREEGLQLNPKSNMGGSWSPVPGQEAAPTAGGPIADGWSTST